MSSTKPKCPTPDNPNTPSQPSGRMKSRKPPKQLSLPLGLPGKVEAPRERSERRGITQEEAEHLPPPAEGMERIFRKSFRHYRTGKIVYAGPGKVFCFDVKKRT